LNVTCNKIVDALMSSAAEKARYVAAFAIRSKACRRLLASVSSQITTDIVVFAGRRKEEATN
jgi:hypothetical protein